MAKAQAINEAFRRPKFSRDAEREEIAEEE